MRAHTPWPEDREETPVWIDIGRSADEILSYLPVLLKSTTIQTLGVMLDANSRPVPRYNSLRQVCLDFFRNIPRRIPTRGLIIDGDDGRRLGAWIMPDNRSNGALEDFLIPLISDSGRPLLDAVDQNLSQLAEFAPFRESHTQKARLYSWLALQDPPSQNPRRALYSRTLDPMSPTAQAFVDWFLELYQLDRSG